MKIPTPAAIARRFVSRSLVAGLLLSQSALIVSAQTLAPADKPKNDKSATEPAVVLEKFEVTAGFRGSLAAAAEIKQEMQGINEIIAAEDIGKLPDVSIADSLTRVTGLTAQRTNGRSQGISIRGLTGDFSTGMLNGREQVTTSMNRAVEFDQYPADLLNGVVVYKTASAPLTGQGLAGTIDMQTVKPLSKSGRVIAANGYYEWTQLGKLTPGAKSKGNRFNLSYVDQFDGGKVGVALGVSHSSKPFEGQQFQAWGFPTDANGAYALGGTKSYVRTSNLDRDGLMAVVEFKPNENIHSTIDVYSSRFEEKQLLRGIEIPMAFYSSAVLQPGYTVSNGLITSSTLTNVQPVVRNDIFKRNDSPFAMGWNLELGRKSAWPVTFDVGYSRVSRSDQNLETYSGIGFRGTATTPDTVTVNLIPGQIPVLKTTLDYSNASVLKLSDPQGWGPATLSGGGMYGYLKYFQSKDEMGQFKLFTKHDLPAVFKDVEFGASYSDRYKRDGEGPSGYVNTPNGQVTLPLPPSVGTTDMGFLGLGRIYAYDPQAAYNSGTLGFTTNPSGGIVARRFKVEEKITQFYTQFNLDSKAGEVPVTGNLGVRAIRADQSSKGLSAKGNNLTAVSDGDKYTEFAPSLNLTFKPAKNTYVRVSAARQVARPCMYDMRASRSWNYDPTLVGSTDISRSPWSGGGGNTKIRPWLANSYDLSLEKYFVDRMGYVSLAGFHKKLLSFIYEQSAVADFTGYPVDSGTEPALRQGVVRMPVNGTGGSVKGLEFTLSLASELLSKNVRGFGVVLGGAYTDSSVKPWGPTGGDAPIAGLSRKVANATLYYERHGFSARVSERYRSENRQYITTFGAPSPGGDVNPNGGFSVAQPENVVDAQVSYSLQSGSAKGLTFFLQAYNLNNEPLVTLENNDPRRVRNYQKYGASYSAGASYKF